MKNLIILLLATLVIHAYDIPLSEIQGLAQEGAFAIFALCSFLIA